MIEHSDALAVLEEYKRRQLHAVNKYEPSDLDGHNQLSYHKSNARVRLLFGGNQSGKSHAAAFDCAINARGRNSLLNRNIVGRDVEIWVIAPEYSLIRNGIYRHLKNIIPDWDLIKDGPRVPGHNLPTYIEVRRKDGYKTLIQFLSAKGETREKFQAAAVDYFYIDEEIPYDIWEELEARTLATSGTFSISATLVESYEWILELERMALKGNSDVFLTRLNTELNPYLDPAAIKYLKEKWSEDTKEYRFYGRARVVRGLIYSRFRRERHVCKPFSIPKDWPKWNAIDPGIRTCASLWIALSPENQAYAYRELYAQNEPLWQVAIEIKKLEKFDLNKDLTVAFSHYVWEETDDSEHMVIRLIDPKSRSRSEAGEESIISQLYSRYGLLCSIPDNAVRPGIEDCRFWLEGETPRILFFDNLENFFDEIQIYRPRPKSARRTQNDPIEDPIRRKNHLMDCWRYIAREHPKWEDRVHLPNYEPTKLTAERIAEKLETQGIANEWLGSNW